jgi:alpha-1,2-mannosyltransferase
VNAGHGTRRARGATVAVDHALIVLPVIATIALFWSYGLAHNLGVDFKQQFWLVGHRVLDGLNPYNRSWQHIAGGVAFPYPAATALLFVPFALISRGASDLLFVLLSMCALAGTLRVLEIRDRRVYGIAFLWFPVINAWQSANLTLVLGLGIALVWRYRDRPMIAGLLTAAVISVKPFVWPIALWLVVTKRYSAAAAGLACGIVINAVAWGVVGVHGVGPYVRLTSDVSRVLHASGYGIPALAAHLGLGYSAALAVEVMLSIAIAGACVLFGRRGRDHETLTLCVALMLVASPLVWNHYFALLIVPLANARPRLGAAWVIPLVLWLCPATDVQTWQAMVAWIVTASLLLWLARLGAAAGTQIDAAVPAVDAGDLTTHSSRLGFVP